MSKYKYPSPEHYAVATSKYRQQFDQYGSLEGEVQLDAAESWIYKLKKADPALHTQFVADAEAWVRRETARLKEKEGPAPFVTTNTFHLGSMHPLETGTSRCAEIKVPSGATYYVESINHIKNLGAARKVPGTQTVVFIPYEKYYDPSSGERRDPWAMDVHLLPCEADDRMDGQGLQGVRRVSVVIILKSVGLAHIYDSTYIAAKLRILALETQKLEEVLKLVITKFDIDDVFDLQYSRVSYDQVSPDSGDPLNIRQRGAYFSEIGLPWLQIGKSGQSNPGSALDRNKTLGDNKVTEEGVIYCMAYKPGNHLTAYGGAGKSGIEKLIDKLK